MTQVPQYVTVITTPNPSGTYTLPSSNGIAFLINFLPGTYKVAQFFHLAGGQDLSLRVWISKLPWDEAIPYPPDLVPWFTLNRAATNLILSDWTLPPPKRIPNQFFLGLVPGTYYANIQNLQNAANQFELRLR
jgi:hypothetical protein